MSNNTIFGGTKIIELKPWKITTDVLRVCKSKVGKRNIRVQKFLRWEDRLKDDEVLQDRINNCMYMNPFTMRKFREMSINLQNPAD